MSNKQKPTRNEAERAVKTLLAYTGDDPDREGLLETPKRVVKAFDEYCQGYNSNPVEHLKTTFGGTDYTGAIVLRGISFSSLCEHHLAPFIGKATVAYIPSKNRVVGLSKLARVVRGFARRLQIQEKLTEEIANAVEKELEPLGVAVMVTAKHQCMSTRGVNIHGSSMVTTSLRGVFKTDAAARAEFFELGKADMGAE